MLGVGIYRGQILPLPQIKRSEMQWIGGVRQSREGVKIKLICLI